MHYFRVPHMKFFIGLNRVKIYQIVGLSCWIPMCFSLNMLNYLNTDEVICASLIGKNCKKSFYLKTFNLSYWFSGLGLTAGLHFASWIVSNNLVVFVYTNKDDQKCQISYISYWGNRKELYCNIEDITPIELSKLSLLNHKIKLKGNSITLKIITRNSTIFNNAKFRKVFGNNIIWKINLNWVM